jgi:hypothetical protein
LSTNVSIAPTPPYLSRSEVAEPSVEQVRFGYLIPTNGVAQNLMTKTLASGNSVHIQFIKSVEYEGQEVHAFVISLDLLPKYPDQGWYIGTGREGLDGYGVDFKMARTEEAGMAGRHARFSWIAEKAGFFVINVNRRHLVRVNGVRIQPFEPRSIPFDNSIQLGEAFFHFQFVKRTERQELAWRVHLRAYMAEFGGSMNPFVIPTPSENDTTWGDYTFHYALGKGAYGTLYAALG